MTSSPTKSSSAKSSPKGGRRALSTSTTSPRPRRHAPPPPSGIAPANVGGASLARKNKSKAPKDNRYSLQVDPRDFHDRHQPNFGSLPRRSGPSPPTRRESIPEPSSSNSSKPPLHPSVSLGSSVGSLQDARLAGYSSFVSPQQSSSSSLQPVSATPARRYSSDGPGHVTTPPDMRRSSTEEVANGGNSLNSSLQQQQMQQNSDMRYQRAYSSSSTGSHGSVNAALASNSQLSNSQRSSSSPSSPRKNRSRSGSKEREVCKYDQSGGGVSAVGPPPVVKLDLPTCFSQSDSLELVEAVRKRTGVSHRKSVIAINEVLEFLKNRVPLCGEMVDGLLSAVQQTQQVIPFVLCREVVLF